MSVFDTMRNWLPGSRDAVGDVPDATPVVQHIEMRGTVAKPKRALPGFRGLVTRQRPQTQNQARLERTRAQLREVFAPTQPVTDPRVFAGRTKVLKQLIEAIEHRMSHVVIFGERGIGKTSILHILGGLAEESDYIVLRATCGSRSEFSAMFRTMLKRVPLRYHASISPAADRTEGGASLADLLPAGEFDARELSEVLGGITSTRLLILLDEYDRIEGEPFRLAIAELIKNLSDLAARVQLVIAGVSSNLDELIGYIPSIRRNVVGLPVQRLSGGEVEDILKIGREATGLSFDDDAAATIVRLGNGSPYLVRLIAYHSSIITLDDGRFDVRQGDVSEGLERMVEEAEGRLPVLVAQRARGADVSGNPATLAHLAQAASTPNGWFTLSDKRLPGVEALLARLDSFGLIERRQVPGEEEAIRLADEGLASFFWILAMREMLATSSNAVPA